MTVFAVVAAVALTGMLTYAVLAHLRDSRAGWLDDRPHDGKGWFHE